MGYIVPYCHHSCPFCFHFCYLNFQAPLDFSFSLCNALDQITTHPVVRCYGEVSECFFFLSFVLTIEFSRKENNRCLNEFDAVDLFVILALLTGIKEKARDRRQSKCGVLLMDIG